MKQYYFLFAFCIIVLSLLINGCSTIKSSAKPNPPKASKGILDLQSWDFKQQHSIGITGELGFSWQKLLEPNKQTDNYLADSWSDGFPQAFFGYGTYQLTVYLPDDIPLGTTYGLQLSYISSSYRLYIDNRLITEVGKVGTSKESTVPSLRPQVVFFTPQANHFKITLQIANFHFLSPFIATEKLGKLSLGLATKLRPQHDTTLAIMLFAQGILLAISIVYFIYFLLRPSMLPSLFFALLCLFAFLRASHNGYIIVMTLFPNYDFNIQIRVFYIATLLSNTALFLFLKTLFPKEFKGVLFNAILALHALYVVMFLKIPTIYLQPSDLSLTILLLFTYIISFYGIIKAKLQQRESINFILGGVILMILSILIETLSVFYKIEIYNMPIVALLFFILIQAYLLARRNEHAWRSMNHLSYELENVNTSLEKRVLQRTQALEQANAQIYNLNEQLLVENKRMESELDVTSRLQQMLLPATKELAAIPKLDIAGINISAHEVGGDYYDVLPYDNKVIIGIGDVTGHGLESGMVMLMTQMGVRTMLEVKQHNPQNILAALNRTLYKNIERMDVSKSMTMSLLSYEYTNNQGQVRLSGQHEELLIMRANGSLQRYDTMDLGFPLGLEEDISQFLKSTSISLKSGDGLVLYTDGITEAEDENQKMYGLERLCKVIQNHWQDKKAQTICDLIIQDIAKYKAALEKNNLDALSELEDDVTLLVIKQK